MIQILSWNIQNGKGVDGEISLTRIVEQIRAMGDPQIICLQEVSRGLPLIEGQPAPDQVLELSDLLPEFECVFGAAIDAAGTHGRWQFGNLILSRLPVESQVTHILPRPGDRDRKQMTRQATEVVVRDGAFRWRVITAHLEFHSAAQRLAQVQRLRQLHEEAREEDLMPPITSGEGPYQSIPRPTDVIICGDFNMLAGSDEYRTLVDPKKNASTDLADAWTLLHPEEDYPPTCGVHDREQWAEGPHCRDFFFVSGQARAGLKRIVVNTTTDASDHQPLMIELEADSDTK